MVAQVKCFANGYKNQKAEDNFINKPQSFA